jgi:uncharacterized OB-fold protein
VGTPEDAGHECPRCGSAASPAQDYCLECGARLPPPEGPPAGATAVVRSGARESLVTVLVAFVVAVLAAAAVVAVQITRDDGDRPLLAATTDVGAEVEPELEPEPAPEPALPPEEEPPPEGEPLEEDPEAEDPFTDEPQQQELISWPDGTDGWTVILASLPTGGGREAANARAREARDAGLAEVGVLVSANYSSLHPGYFNVFSGVHETIAEAEAAVPAAREAGFDDAYPRRVTP